MSTTVEKFAEWSIVEVMGHKRFAGYVTEQSIGGVSFVRVDVPQIEHSIEGTLPAFTKLFGAASIYCISPCTEQTARAFASQLRSESFSRYEAPRLESVPVVNGVDDYDDDDDLDDMDIDDIDLDLDDDDDDQIEF